MRLFLIIILFISFANIGVANTHNRNSVIHIIFDLDWTLISQVDRPTNLSQANIVQYAGEYYRVADHVPELIKYLHEQPNIKVSFFSGGGEGRNLAVLDQVKLPDSDISILEVAYKVLSFNDLTTVGDITDSSLSFTQKYKKDISRISNDLKNVVIVDDNLNFALPGHEKNYIRIGKPFSFFETYEEVLKAVRTGEEEYIPRSFNEWKIERNRFLSLFTAIKRSVDIVKKSERGFRDVLREQFSMKENCSALIRQFIP